MKPLRACNRYNCDTLAFVVSSGLRGVKEWKRGDISLKLTPANSPAPPPRRRLYLNALHPLWFPVGLEFRDVPSLGGFPWSCPHALRDARGDLEARLARLRQHPTSVVEVLPDETLRGREALTACLTEEPTGVSRQLADAVDENWVAWWEKMMAGKFVDVPNLQH